MEQIRKRLMRSFGIASSLIAVAGFASCATPHVVSEHSVVREDPMSFHRQDDLRQLALRIIDESGADLTSSQRQEMLQGSKEEWTLFEGDGIAFYELGAWRFYFGDSLNLNYVQYYHAATKGIHGWRLIAEIDNTQVEWNYNGRVLIPRAAEKSGTYSVKQITNAILEIGDSGSEITLATKQFRTMAIQGSH